MRDPFKPNSNKQLVREAQFGFTVIGLLVATLIYVAWFRLNGLDDVTPEHIRNSPVAMQVFPNSPNYDRESHTMRSPNPGAVAAASPKQAVPMQVAPIEKPTTTIAPTFGQSQLTDIESQRAMVKVPKRIMNDSNRTARSLQEAAESIEQSANRVATLANAPNTKKPFGLVSNPATKGESDSGFKVLKKQDPVVAKLPAEAKETASVLPPSIANQPWFNKKSSVEATPRIATKPPASLSTTNESSTASRFNAGSRFSSVTATPKIETKPPTTPAAVNESSTASRFNAGSRFSSVTATPKIETKPPATPAAVNESSTASRFNAGSRFGSNPVIRTPTLSTMRDFSLPKIESKVETSNDFRPIQSKTFLNMTPSKNQPQANQPATPDPDKLESVEGEPVESATVGLAPVEATNVEASAAEPEAVAPKPFSGFVPPKKATELDATIPRLPKLPDQSLNDLRSSTKLLSPESRPTPSVETVSFEQATWTVKKGDSFWSIAQSNYGDGRFFRALYEKNRRLVPGFENLTEGVELDLPTVDQLVKSYPDLCPGDAVRKNDPWRETPDELMDELTIECDTKLDQRFYETKSGDTLFEVARRQLGQASRYVELIELNEFRIDANVTHETGLPSGIQLLLPKE